MYLVEALLSFYKFLIILPRNRINYYCRCVCVCGEGGLGFVEGIVKRGRWSKRAGGEGIQLRYRCRDIGPIAISNPAQRKVIQTKISKP